MIYVILISFKEKLTMILGQYSLSSTSATKVYINLEIAEVDELLQRQILHIDNFNSQI